MSGSTGRQLQMVSTWLSTLQDIVTKTSSSTACSPTHLGCRSFIATWMQPSWAAYISPISERFVSTFLTGCPAGLHPSCDEATASQMGRTAGSAAARLCNYVLQRTQPCRDHLQLSAGAPRHLGLPACRKARSYPRRDTAANHREHYLVLAADP